MFPRLLTLPEFDLLGYQIGPLTLHTYGALLAVAFVAGLWVASRQARKAGLEASLVSDLAIYLLIAGLVGAKLLLVVVEWDYYSQNMGQIGSILQSGGVFYGGLLAALPVAWWYTRRHALPVWQVADVLAPAVVIGQAIGRLGCFTAGCCHGRPADVPWAVTFRDIYATRAVGTPIDTPLHPTQLYEALAALVIFLVLVAMSSRKRFHGQIMLSYVALYSAARFGVEFFRGDASRGTVLDGLLSTSQFVGILLFLGAVALTPYLLKKQSTAPKPA